MLASGLRPYPVSRGAPTSHTHLVLAIPADSTPVTVAGAAHFAEQAGLFEELDFTTLHKLLLILLS
jgi:hypothetical protein